MRGLDLLAVLLGLGLMGAGCDQLGLGSTEKAEADEADDSDEKDSDEDEDEDEDEKDSKKKKKKKKDKKSADDDEDEGDDEDEAVHAYVHLPDDCDVVVALDVKSLLAQKSVKKELLPLIEDAVTKKDVKDDDFKDFQGFLEDAKIDPKKTVSDLAVCVRGVPDRPKFGVALAGSFKKETIVKAFEKRLKASEKKDVIEIDGRKAISDDKMTLGQAADGTVVFGDDKSLFTAMAKESSHYKSKYDLPVDKDLAFSVPDGLAKRLASADSGAPKEFAAIKDVVGSLDLSKGKAIIRLATKSADDAEKLNALLVLMKGEFKKDLGSSNSFGEADALESAKSRQDGKDVVIEVSLPDGALDKGVEALAKEMQTGITRL
jgi:hypothetical protein